VCVGMDPTRVTRYYTISPVGERELGLGVRDPPLISLAQGPKRCRATRRRMDTKYAGLKFLPFNDQQSVQGKRCRAYGPFFLFNRFVRTCPLQRSEKTGPCGTKGTDESIRDEHIAHIHQITLIPKLHRSIHVWDTSLCAIQSLSLSLHFPPFFEGSHQPL